MSASKPAGCLVELVASFLSQWWLWIPIMIGSAKGDEAGGKAFLVCLGIKGLLWLGERSAKHGGDAGGS